MKSLSGHRALLAAVQQRLGVRLPASLEPRLVERAQRLVDQGHARGLSHLAGVLLEAGEADRVLHELRQAVSIAETYFFRAPRQLDHLGQLLLEFGAGLAGGVLRLLSAGCATGEEAYSLAMVASRAFPQGRVEVVGVDMNPASLETARAAEYGPRSLRGQPAGELPLDQVSASRWRVREAVRRKVSFVHGNLVTDELARLLPGGFQVVVVRNVLLYASARDGAQVLGKLAALAAPRALFLTGPVEAGVAREQLSDCESCGHGIWWRPSRRAPSPSSPPPTASLPWAAPPPAVRAAAPVRVGATSRPPEEATHSGQPERSRGPLDGLGASGGHQPVGSRPKPAPAPSALAAARAAADRDDWAAAAPAVRAAIAEAPDEPLPRWLAGTIELGRGDAVAAQRHFEAALFLRREFLPALLGLAQALERAGLADQARGHYQRLLKAAEALPPQAPVAPLDVSAGALARLALTALAGRVRP